MCTVVAALVLKKCENQHFFSRSVASCSHSLSTEKLHPPWGKHGVGGCAGLALLLRENRQPGHREAPGEVRPGWQLPVEGQRDGTGPLLSVCEVSCESSSPAQVSDHSSTRALCVYCSRWTVDLGDVESLFPVRPAANQPAAALSLLLF